MLYSCISSTHRLGSDTTVGERSMLFQKNSYDHARSIYEMHSNESGRVCPRTLVDRKRKRYVNAVDVVEHLHDPTNLAPNVQHLRVQHTFRSMTSLELLIQQRVEGEFCQHDGVVMVM